MIEVAKKNLYLGGFFILLAATAYASMGAVVKIGEKIPDTQLVFFRNFVCLLTLLPWLFLPKHKSIITTFSIFLNHLIRASAGLLNMYCFFYSIRYILLTDAMLLNNTMPLFLPLVLWVWKQRRIKVKLIPGLIIGFAGVIFILHPSKFLFQPGALLALASGFFMSISMAGVRELSKIEPIYRILFYYFAISSAMSAIPLIWTWKNLPSPLWGALVLVGVSAAIYQFFLTKGFQLASASVVSPMIYFAVILSGFFDWIFWDNIPSMMSYIGVVLVIIGAVWCIKSEGSGS